MSAGAASGRWFVCMTLARAEAIADHYLRQAGYGTLYLHWVHKGLRSGRQTYDAIKPYFPRYVFLEVAPHQGLYAAAKAQGVHSIVGFAGEAVEVPERVMDELRRRCDRTGRLPDDDPAVAHLHHVGSTVRITGGPLEGFLAEVRLDNGREIRLWIEVFGRKTEAKIPSSHVEAASPALAAL